MVDINAIMAELAQYTRMAEETAATVDGLKDTIKKYMEENQLETLTGNEHKATYKTVTSSRIDTAALKRNAPDIAEKYTKTTETKRFTFA
jgi:predicted phage-related endonuclease